MLICRDYSEEKLLDRAWYQSSNIVYSECDDKEDDLKTLRVVFKNGAQYQYENISVQDYLLFMYGGIDGSNGKALNKFIKEKKYEYKRIDDADISLLNEEMNNVLEQQKKEAIS
jgi:hypothetical protein